METHERLLSVLLEASRLKIRSEQEVLERLDRIERMVIEISRALGLKNPTQESEPIGGAVAMNIDQLNEVDTLVVPAMDFFLEGGQVSTSLLQRKMKIGYARAARIVDFLTEKEWVSPPEGSKVRDVLISQEQWDQLRAELLAR